MKKKIITLCFWFYSFLVYISTANADHIPRLGKDRLTFQDSWTYIQSLENSKAYSSLSSILERELNAIEVMEAKLAKGINFTDEELEIINKAYKKYGSTDPLNDFLIRNRVDGKKRYYDLEGKVYILDDLAEIYSQHLVDFKKSQLFNSQALKTYELIKTVGLGNIPVSDYYNKRRALFYCFYPLSESATDDVNAPDQNLRSSIKTEKHFYGRIDMATLFPKDYLDIVRNIDLENLRNRVLKRKDYLNQKLGISENKKELSYIRVAHEITTIKEILSKHRVFNNYYMNWYLASLMWNSSNLGAPIDYKVLSELCEQALKSTDDMIKDDVDSLNMLRYWLGLSYLKTGRTQAGISIIENFFGEIKKADLLEEKKAKDRIRVLQKIDEQKIKNAETFQIVSSILSSAVNIGGNIAATRVLSQNYSTMNQAYAAMDKTQLISNVSKLASNVINMTASLQASRAALMADTQNKLSGYISSLVLEVVRYLNKYEQVELYVEIAHGYKKVGNKAMAIKYFKEAIGIIELQRSTISAETQRINFDDIKEHLYSELISLLIETNKPKEAFRYVEKIKSRAMLDVLSRREIVLRSEDETESFNAIMKEREEIASLLNHSKLSIEQLGMIEKKGTRGVKILSTLKKGIEFELLATGKTVAFSTAAELSKGDFSILEYFTTDSAIIIFLFDRGTLFVKVMPIKKQGLYDLINVFRMELSDNKNLNSKDDSADKLYELLISPVLDHISQKRLYIVPHGWLHYIPYQALKRNSRYLVEEFAITYVPSVTILKTLHDRNMKTNASIFIIGNPNVGDSLYDLKYAEEEAVSIGMKFGNKDKKVLVREYATETMFKEYSYKYDVVHIAAHAFFNCDNPLHSYILLRGDEKNDGRLYANEFYKMKLSSSLLTMSACNTGLSYVSKGDEIIGLNRGVMYAGVDSIVSSLWNVDDRSTAYLMSIFYQNLTKMPKDIALQKAQIHTIKSFPNPYAWAPFVLSGKKD